MATLAYQVVENFEQTIAEYAGSKYAVAVESCSAALFLCCVYLRVGKVLLPKFTYPSVPASVIHAGGRVQFYNGTWEGVYALKPYPIIDGALRFSRGMYKGGLHCLSFHSKKLLPIGRGGMILTNVKEEAEWFKLMRFDGRPQAPLSAGVKLVGWNMYLTPEQAARGLMLFDLIKNENFPDLVMEEQGYIDLSEVGLYDH